MNEEYSSKGKTALNILQSVRHIAMALLFLAMGIMMFFAEKFEIEQLLTFDKVFRYIFGSVCVLYGVFRLYRAFKKEY